LTIDTHTTNSKMDLGIQFTKDEEDKIREEARKEIEQEDRSAAEAAQAVDAKVGAEAEVEALNDTGLAESDEGSEPVNVDELLEKEMPKDEGYESDEEEDSAKALAVADGGDAEAASSTSDPVDTLDDASIGDGPITPDSSDGEITGSYPSTPLDSPLASIDEDPEDEGFVEGDVDSVPENKITPQGSTDEIQTDSEVDESQDGLLLSDDDGLSEHESDEKKRNFNRKIVKLELKADRKAALANLQEADGKEVSVEKEGRGFAL
jgi:hypothetical protein